MVVVKIMVHFLGTLNIRYRIILGTQRGTLILTTTHINAGGRILKLKAELRPLPNTT